MSLQTFNSATPAEAAALIRPCADVDSWVETLVAGRPFGSVEAVLTLAADAAESWNASDVDSALAHHPRIGERAEGGGTEATMSRSEQGGLKVSDDVSAALLTGNREYEERFGRVFLIRAAGRTAPEILAELTRRLGNTDADESREVADQLRQIALLRLEGVLSA